MPSKSVHQPQIGERFGHLTVIGLGPRVPCHNSTLATWECACDCGGTRNVRRWHLLQANKIPSCGCYTEERRVAAVRATTKHGFCRHPERLAWVSMIHRCHVESDAQYRNYGGRGIAVCQEWRDSYDAFLRDMGKRPSSDYSIERTNNSLGYSPGNCIWATQIQQANNRRTNRIVEFNGDKRTFVEWSRLTGIPVPTLFSRISELGWSVEKAFTTPSRHKAKAGEGWRTRGGNQLLSGN